VDEEWDRLRRGEDGARDALVRAYGSLVVAAVDGMHLPADVARADAVDWGTFGLVDAIEAYRPDCGPFEPYAVLRVVGAVSDELRDLS
jgi:DNA-directed RNA polymerase specialized sigma subunit